MNDVATDRIVRLTAVKHVFHQGGADVTALVDVTLEVAAREFLVVMGPSGSGKTTLLHIMAGLLDPTNGDVEVCGHALSGLGETARSRLRRRRIGVVFQAFNLLPALTVAENVALPLLLDGRPDREVRARVDELLAAVGLVSRRDHLPDELSGGECQRVAIARALVANPALVLADEPTGNLDSGTGFAVLELLKAVQQRAGAAVVLATHDERAVGYGDRTIRLEDGRTSQV